MRNFWPVFKRELRVYFTSPIAYAVTTIFLVIAGYFFYNGLALFSLLSLQASRNPYIDSLNISDMVISPMIGNISIILLLMLPVLTMRLFSEEKKSGTFELLFSYPVRDIEVLLGKYLSALTVVVIMLGLTGLYQLILMYLGVNDDGVMMTGYLGLFLMAAAFIALGLFISSMTENQIVAAVVSFGVLLLFWVVGWSASSTEGQLRAVLEYISLVSHLIGFAKGMINTADIAYYLLFIFLFLFLTLRSLESKRWRG